MLTRYLSLIVIATMSSIMLGGCSGRSATVTAEAADSNTLTKVTAPTFNGDSAYNYVARQVAFGPRVPGTEAHRKCALWIADELHRHNADTVMLQRATVKNHKNASVEVLNIMGRYNPQNPAKVLLLAHYDTRPTADQDPVKANRSNPVPGANDGGSGVAVLLEAARAFAAQRPDVGVDLLFVDVEDSGEDTVTDSWCLGSQYWSKNLPYGSGEPLPRYGILVDMVGGKDAKFNPEYISMAYASDVVSKVWSRAHVSGFADMFPTSIGAAVTDDHIPVNEAGIPCIDIIENQSPATDGFPAGWHTLADDMGAIDQATLKAVGQTILNVIYNE